MLHSVSIFFFCVNFNTLVELYQFEGNKLCHAREKYPIVFHLAQKFSYEMNFLSGNCIKNITVLVVNN